MVMEGDDLFETIEKDKKIKRLEAKLKQTADELEKIASGIDDGLTELEEVAYGKEHGTVNCMIIRNNWNKLRILPKQLRDAE